jgi:hypothetical protein
LEEGFGACTMDVYVWNVGMREQHVFSSCYICWFLCVMACVKRLCFHREPFDF